MHIRIYHNNIYDYVVSFMFEKMLTRGVIAKFFRPSENRWVQVGVDAMRSKESTKYFGVDRRSNKRR